MGNCFVPCCNKFTVKACGFILWDLGNSFFLLWMILLFKWNKLSLTYKEGKSLSLSMDKQIHEFVLVAKFLMKRNVNIDAVAKTFRPLWRTTQRFNVGMLVIIILRSIVMQIPKLLEIKR